MTYLWDEGWISEKVCSIASGYLLQRATEGTLGPIGVANEFPREFINGFRETHLFRLALPKALGGEEQDPLSQTAAIELVAVCNPALAWLLMIWTDGQFWVPHLSLKAAREIYSVPSVVCASGFTPTGSARRVDGGYLVSGEWPFVSGFSHASWVALGCLMREDASSPPWVLMAFVPTEKAESLENWNSVGMRPTGSVSIRCSSLFVPNELTFRWSDDEKQFGGKLYDLPTLFFSNLPGVMFGISRAAFHEALRILDHKTVRVHGTPVKDQPHVQIAFARAHERLLSCRDRYYTVLARVWNAVLDERPLTLVERAAYRGSMTFLHAECLEAIQSVRQLCTTDGIDATARIARLADDAVVVSQHIMANQATWQDLGVLHFGGEPATPLL